MDLETDKAGEWRRQLDAGEVANKAEITRREGITWAKVTQVLGLLRLAPGDSEDDPAGIGRPDRS